MTEPDPSTFLGYWKITWMEVWAQKYVDLVVPGYFDFEIEEDRLMGSFQFGAVVGWLDCRLRDVNDVTFVEWTWEGRNDSDPASGRGFAELVDGELVGRIFIHAADDSAFKAIKQSRPAKRPLSTSEPREKSARTRPN